MATFLSYLYAYCVLVRPIIAKAAESQNSMIQHGGTSKIA